MTGIIKYGYDHDGNREQDDRRAAKIRDLIRAGIYDEAQQEAGKMIHLRRSDDLIDRISRERQVDR